MQGLSGILSFFHSKFNKLFCFVLFSKSVIKSCKNYGIYPHLVTRPMTLPHPDSIAVLTVKRTSLS